MEQPSTMERVNRLEEHVGDLWQAICRRPEKRAKGTRAIIRLVNRHGICVEVFADGIAIDVPGEGWSECWVELNAVERGAVIAGLSGEKYEERKAAA